MTYRETFEKILDLQNECIEEQNLIDVARASFPKGRRFQQRIDEEQKALDEKRRAIAVAVKAMARQN